MNKRAIISVFDKTGLGNFARGLVELGFQIISTGGTARYLKEEKIPVTSVADITGFPEILGGRVKTLHPAILGGILARRNLEADLQQLKEQDIELVDLVAVNLYPFAQTIARKDVTLAEAVENIDIGGPTMVRAAAKNYQHVAVVVNPARYDEVLEKLKKGELDENFRFRLATEAFAHTAEYDALISRYFAKECPEVPDFPPYISFPFVKTTDLRYGENPQQKAAFYQEVTAVSDPASITSAQQLQGKELSFNNYNDLDAAWEMAIQFKEPTVVAVKHTNPCGIASADSVYQAYLRAF
ncbi:MAG TPA: bifunctional phosphoribosylaminoimidazolecarboxamide formyltransferase/IMP cyclohydrolase, partial [Firmicutes bacterium]|nr:bifunctional phosphoribosylaminoimidazolecarboxamide formyltransferase/IMP cyclohydrolase [Bacillota bacterium]